MKHLAAGRLRHYVRIEERTDFQDPDTGEITPVWTPVSGNEEVPCEISAVSVAQFLQSQAEQTNVSVKITIRQRSGLDHTMRLVGLCDCHLNRIYNPKGWLEDPESGKEWLTAPCSEGVNEG